MPGQAPTPTRWQRMKGALSGYLDGQPLPDELGPATRREVLGLAACDAGLFLEEPAMHLAAPPEEVGAYRITSLLGRGGMGAVYRAERSDGQFTKTVAVKFLPPAAGAIPEWQSRFELERRILAMLEHPNMARLIDGGATEDGVPYLIMEFVEGMGIEDYVRGQALDRAGRIRLFLSICAAVEYAHGRGVVHRDLKPANIMVTGDGMVKLLDFGIARLLGDGEPGAPPMQSGVNPLTPGYASPEQLRGEPAGPASDQYSLAVILEEMLGGDVPTDLRYILDRAMAPQPGGRYASVQDFADDLGRFLEGRPVEARPASWWYPGIRLAQRNRLAAVVCLAGMAAAGASTYWAHRHRREQQRAGVYLAHTRKLAETILTDLSPQLEALPNSAPQRRRILDRALQSLARLEEPVALDPVIRGHLVNGYVAIAAASFRTGDLHAAEREYRRAAELLRLLPAPPDGRPVELRRAGILQELAAIYVLLDRESEAIRDLEEALGLLESPDIPASYSREVWFLAAKLHLSRGEHFRRKADHAQAIEAFRRSVGYWALVGDYRAVKSKLQQVWVQLRIADLEEGMGNAAAARASAGEARRLFREAMAKGATQNDRDYFEARFAITDAVSYTRRGMLRPAIQAWQRALGHQSRRLEREPSYMPAALAVAESHHAMGALWLRLKNATEARASLGRALAIRREVLAKQPNRPDARRQVAETLAALGDAAAMQGEREQASALYRQAHEISPS